jgi:hypothetical protein
MHLTTAIGSFPDEQVLQPNFMEHLLETARAIQPLIA